MGQNRSITLRLHFLTGGCLARSKESFRILPFAAKLERTEILKPFAKGNNRSAFHPKSQLIQIPNRNIAVMHSLNQVVSNCCRQAGPDFDLGHYSPKTIRPNSSPSRFASAGLSEARNRSANSKNSRSFRRLASIPSSIRSSNTRLSLNRRRLAMP